MGLNLVLKEVSREKSGRGSLRLSTPFLEDVCVVRKRVVSKLWFANSIVPFASPLSFLKSGGSLCIDTELGARDPVQKQKR